MSANEIYVLITRALPFVDLTRTEFDKILAYLEGGGESLAQQYGGVFGKVIVDDHGIVSLAHPRIAREFLVNIGTIVSEGFVDVLLKRRRIGSVEEGFIKGLNIGDLFVLSGRVLRLIDTGVQEVFAERADGQLPTIPRWNAAKMPLTSGLARAVRELRFALSELEVVEVGVEAVLAHEFDVVAGFDQLAVFDGEAPEGRSDDVQALGNGTRFNRVTQLQPSRFPCHPQQAAEEVDRDLSYYFKTLSIWHVLISLIYCRAVLRF